MFRPIVPAALSLALALALAACAASPAPSAGASSAQPIAEVQSGDHLVIGGQTIVLADAETPQAGDYAMCRAEAVAAQQTAARVRALLADARQVEVHRVAKGHRALVHVDGLDLGLTLISEGLAVRRGPAATNWCVSTRPWSQLSARRPLVSPVWGGHA
ncbi:hypothetical protein [Phenylobacterium sp.]|uniref:hypothetical protein n=1 Tax=Phenylobacterium sp. TaxID=1871053 RepID=UPI002BAE1811|nr:hypothetical protein [Phenylobacterium sp.]HLZ74767.1 hypothetical protein [Phenylobacterium sp.]